MFFYLRLELVELLLQPLELTKLRFCLSLCLFSIKLFFFDLGSGSAAFGADF